MIKSIMALMHKLPALLNIFTDIIENIQDFFIGFFTYILYWPLSLLTTSMAFVCDIIQSVCMQLAGIGPEVSNSAFETNSSGDIVMDFVRNSAIQTVFRNLMLVAIVLILVFCVFAILKSEYAQDTKTTKAQIVGRSVKALFTFILVPALTFGGIFISNKLLQTLYMATTTSQTETVSQTLFTMATYNANRARVEYDANGVAHYVDKEFYDAISGKAVNSINGGYFGFDAPGGEEIATQIDYAMIHGVSEKLWDSSALGDGLYKDLTPVTRFLPGSFNPSDINYFNTYAVAVYYDTWSINWIYLIVGDFFALFLLCKLIIGLIMRVFNIAFLYVISPPIVAMMPLDNGSAFGNWKKEMVKNVLSAYGAVVGMNLFLIFTSAITNLQFSITLFGINYNSFMVSKIMQFLFLLVGLKVASGFPGKIAGFIGAGDASKDGGDMAKSVAANAGKVAMVAAGGVGLAASGAKMAFRGAKSVGGGIKNVGKSFLTKEGRDARSVRKEERKATKETIKSDKKLLSAIDDSGNVKDYGKLKGVDYANDNEGRQQQRLSALDRENARQRAKADARVARAKKVGGGLLKGGKGVAGAIKSGFGTAFGLSGIGDTEGAKLFTKFFGKGKAGENDTARSKIVSRLGLGEDKKGLEAVNNYTNIMNERDNKNIQELRKKHDENLQSIQSAKAVVETLEAKNKNGEALTLNEKKQLKQNKAIIESKEKENIEYQESIGKTQGAMDARKKLSSEINKKHGYSDKLSEEHKAYRDMAVGYQKEEDETVKIAEKTAGQMGLDEKGTKDLANAMKEAIRSAYAAGDSARMGEAFRNALNNAQLKNVAFDERQLDKLVNKFNENVVASNQAKEMIKQMADSEKKQLDEIKKLLEKGEKKDGKDGKK